MLTALLGSANLSSRRPLFEQYDPIVQSRTVRRPDEADAAVLRLYPESDSAKGIAVSIDGNGRRVACDPYTGTVEAVLECAANLACVGGEPLGLTNCLNFGNPEKPHVAWQLQQSVAGMTDALTAIGVPVVGGNVSLYNESGGGPIYPTPVVGMVGAVPDVAATPVSGFGAEGDLIALVQPAGFAASEAGSELAKLRGQELPLGLPPIDVEAVKTVLDAIRAAARSGKVTCIHDVAEGGLAVALAECCVAGGIGAAVGADRRSVRRGRRPLRGVRRARGGRGAGRRLRAHRHRRRRRAAHRGAQLDPERTDGRQGIPGARLCVDATRVCLAQAHRVHHELGVVVARVVVAAGLPDVAARTAVDHVEVGRGGVVQEHIGPEVAPAETLLACQARR